MNVTSRALIGFVCFGVTSFSIRHNLGLIWWVPGGAYLWIIWANARVGFVMKGMYFFASSLVQQN